MINLLLCYRCYRNFQFALSHHTKVLWMKLCSTNCSCSLIHVEVGSVYAHYKFSLVFSRHKCPTVENSVKVDSLKNVYLFRMISIRLFIFLMLLKSPMCIPEWHKGSTGKNCLKIFSMQLNSRWSWFYK